MLINERQILIVAGPCSAESREQTLETAKQLAEYCKPDVFRAGIWKSRTSRNTFEGIGADALQWLREVKSVHKMPVAAETISPQHVQLCLEADIDYIWLGARTVVNPYMVGEICEALKGTNMKVLVKNPVNPDIRLWIGAIERVANSGISEIIAVHRGFSTYYNQPYRNMPLWEIPNELKRVMPDLKIICDPSHICGREDCLKDIMQQALDLEMNGLMVESHINPKTARSDKEQQITPRHLSELLSGLILRNPGDSPHQLLQHLRNEIDMIDGQLLETLARRMHIIEEIGQFKRDNRITILQAERSRHVFADRIEKGNRLQLHIPFLKEILKSIHNEAIRIQVDILNKDTKENQAE